MDKKRILIVTPHLSTGGAPQVTLNKIQLLNDEYDIRCVEYSQIAWTFIVQRNKIIDILGDNFISLPENKSVILDIIKNFNPDIISFEEFPEFFMDDNITNQIYKKDKNYRIFETTHDSSFPVQNKRFFPDKFHFVSAFSALRYSMYDVPFEIIEYPVDKKIKNQKECQESLDFDSEWKHVVNVGLFTPRKNQSYIFDLAHYLINYKIKFHFIGNQAENFKYYWEPLLNNKPDNCVIWGERNDVDTFLRASDLFLFTSRGDKHNKELNPIAIKEALEYDMPMMMYNLDVYCGKYNNNKHITFLTGNIEMDKNNLIKVFNMMTNENTSLKNLFSFSFENETNKICFSYSGDNHEKVKITIRDITSTAPIYWVNLELHPYTSYFIIPIPIHITKFYQDPYLRGFNIEFYDQKNEFLFSEEIIVNDIFPKIKKINFLPFDCNYVNYYEFFAERSFDKDCLNDLDLVIDIGANVGLFAKYVKDRGAKNIIMIEGNPLLGESINSVMGDEMKDCILFLNPVFSEKKMMKFNYPSDNTTIGELVFNDHYPYNTTIDIETITLDEIYNIVGDRQISLFKCDIEGGEYPLFKSITNEQIKKVNKFMIEFHKNNNNEIKIIIDRLIENGFEFDIVNTHMGIRTVVDMNSDHGFIITK